jgi:hypothetical protein
MPWPRQLDRFPLFTVERISTSIDDPSDICVTEGVVTNCARALQPKQSIWLASDVLNSAGIGGEIISHDAATGRAVLRLWHAGNLAVGNNFPLLDSYFNPYQVAMVLDENRRWTRTRFSPRDAIATPGPNGFTCLKPLGGGGSSRYYPPRPGDTSPESGGQVIAGSWDHEHCNLCDARISPPDAPEGYVDDRGHWVCCRCFEAYVAKHDLGFIG